MNNSTGLVFLLRMNTNKILDLYAVEPKLREGFDGLTSEFEFLLQPRDGASNKQGVVYSKNVESFFIVQKLILSPSDDIYYLLSSILLEHAIQYYYQRRLITTSCLEFFEKHADMSFINDQKGIQMKLKDWKQKFDGFFSVPNDPYSQQFYFEEMEYFIRVFDGRIAELFYAILMEFPIILHNIANERIIEIIDTIDLFVPSLTSRQFDKTADQKDQFSQIIYSQDRIDINHFEHYYSLDFQSQTIEFSFDQPIPMTFTNVVDKALQDHEEELMPLRTSIYVKLVTIIEKIFVVLIMNGGEIDFADYLHMEERDMKSLYNSVFSKIAFQTYRIAQ